MTCMLSHLLKQSSCFRYSTSSFSIYVVIVFVFNILKFIVKSRKSILTLHSERLDRNDDSWSGATSEPRRCDGGFHNHWMYPSNLSPARRLSSESGRPPQHEYGGRDPRNRMSQTPASKPSILWLRDRPSPAAN